jgi:hypothetical protein
MKNIHLLPTNKGQRITKTDEGKLLWCSTLAKDFIEIRKGYLGYHIYITSDEEIKEGDWVIFNELEIVKCIYSKNGEYLFSKPLLSSSNHHFSYFKKIILTTDQDLITNGVQSIDDEFLQWFVENPSCEVVKTIKVCSTGRKCDDKGKNCKNAKLKIIIPQVETIEGAAEEFVNNTRLQNHKVLFMEGAKWQQEQILNFLYEEITERRPYSASKMCEEVIKFIKQF